MRKSLRADFADVTQDQGKPGPPRIELCGGIASGKTTLAKALAMRGASSSLKSFEDNPFWSAFYEDPIANAFEAEISFLLWHYHGIKQRCHSEASVVVCDYSLVLDLAYAATTLAADDLPVFLSVYGIISKRLPPPVLIVYLCCNAAEELRRIAERGREVERTATRDLLVRLKCRDRRATCCARP